MVFSNKYQIINRIISTILSVVLILSFILIKSPFTNTIEKVEAVETGLISQWSAEGNADDVVGTNNGTMMNGAMFAPGRVGQAFSFDGIDDYVSVPDSDYWNLTSLNGTIEMWIKANTLSGNNGHGLINQINNDQNWALYVYNNGSIAVGRAGVNEIVSSPGIIVPGTGQWYHIVTTKSGSTTTIYVNGTNVASNTTAVWTDTSNLLRIGGHRHLDIDYYFNGVIDEVRIYDRALSSTEIADEYNNTPPSVDSVSPANGATGVPVNTVITAAFSEDMDASTIDTSSFTLNNGVTGNVTYDAPSKIATFTPSSSLSYNTTYTASISTAVKDSTGNNLPENYSWSFTTELPPWDGPGVYMSRASVDADEQEANGYNMVSSISSNGRYIAFYSDASNLVSDDTNNKGDIFRKDLQTGEVIRVSTDSSGNEANSGSWYSSISSNGRYVVFDSGASNLVSDDTNGQWDIFRKDLQTGTTVRVSTDSIGNQANSGSDWASSISSDGRYVAFSSAANNLVAGDTNSKKDIFRKDLQTGEIEIVSTDQSDSQADAASWDPSMSADGRYIAFHSGAANLVSGDTNGTGDIFRKDMETKEIVRATTDSLGNQAYGYSDSPSISSDGRYIVFFSVASNLVSGDTNAKKDIFRKDLETSQTVRVNVDSVGNQANDESNYSSISSDGRYVVFDTKASNLIPNDSNNDWDVYRKDMQTDEITRINVNSLGYQSDFSSKYTEKAPTISSDGRFIVFDSIASDMVSGDSNIKYDIFFADMSLYPQITDYTPPTTSYTLEPSEANNGWFNITPTVTLTSTEDGNTYYSWTSTPNYKYMYPIAAPEGEKTLYYYSTDLFGNRETGKTTSIKVDLTPPSLDFGSEYPDLSFVRGDLTFNPAVSDNLSGLSVTNFYVNESLTVASLDASPSFNLNTLTLPDGNLTIKAETIDNAGNTSSVERTYIVDNTLPTVNAGTDKTVRMAFTQSASATDNGSGIATYQWTQELGPGTVSFSEPASPTTSIGATADGNYTIRLTVTDNAGNEYYDDMTLIWDTVAPTTNTPTIQSKIAKSSLGWYRTNVTVSISAADNTNGSGLEKIYYKIGSTGTLNSTSAANVKIPIKTEGIKTIYYYSKDNAGNEETQKPVTVKIDKSKPRILSYSTSLSSVRRGKYIGLKYRAADTYSPKVYVTVKVINPKGKTILNKALGYKSKSTSYAYSYKIPSTAVIGTNKYIVILKDYAGWSYQTSAKYFKVVK